MKKSVKLQETPEKYKEKAAILKRNAVGLYDNIEYIWKENGKIDWVKMVDPKYLVPNRTKFPQGTDLQSLNVSELPDDKKLIMLAGLKKLAKLRGTKSVKYSIAGGANESFCAVSCDITWIPNLETGMEEETSSGCADAHFHNTDSFAKYYCAPISSNRAFARSVRDMLEIEILAYEEIGPKQEEIQQQIPGINPHENLKTLLKNKNWKWESVKNALIKDEFAPLETIESWVEPEKVPVDKVFAIMEHINKKLSAAAKK